ncbi:MAG TPA: Sec-independent protein translocase subunit TatA [Pseudonocardiaceae bacterium]|nr:Sec-independent protein translocase subunit TatA [Pseudonocardiaceae bacterium]
MGIPTGWELIVLLAVLVLLFGATKLPTAARSIGQSLRIFKAETKGLRSDGEDAASATQRPQQQPAQQEPAQQEPAQPPPGATPPQVSPQQVLPPSPSTQPRTPVEEPQRGSETTR